VRALDAADLAAIAGRLLGIDADAALDRMEIPAAQAALAEAVRAEAPLAEAALAETGPPGREPNVHCPDRAVAAAASVALVRALLRHRPFAQRNQQVAVAAWLQFLSLNGWQADLNPAATTVVVIEALASGRLAPGDAAAWLSPRLSPAPLSRGPRVHQIGRALAAPRRSRAGRLGRRLAVPAPVGPVSAGPVSASAVSASTATVTTLLAVTVGSVVVLAAACSRAPDMSSATSAKAPATAAAKPPAVRQSPAPASVRSADVSYAVCMRAHGLGYFPDPSDTGVAAIAPATVVDLSSIQFRSAQRSCQAVAPAAVIRIVTAR